MAFRVFYLHSSPAGLTRASILADGLPGQSCNDALEYEEH
jgi:hypothetical protein